MSSSVQDNSSSLPKKKDIKTDIIKMTPPALDKVTNHPGLRLQSKLWTRRNSNRKRISTQEFLPKSVSVF